MKKKTKGLVAGAVGAALLLGTGGTFALWHDSANLGKDSVATGDLRLGEAEVDWVWANVSNAAGTIQKGHEFHGGKLVPGDAIAGTLDLAGVTLIGDTLRANLYLDGIEFDADEFAPLVVLVDGEEPEIGDDGTLLLAQLTPAQVAAEEFVLPSLTVTLGFPVDAPGHLPGDLGDNDTAGNGYGRKRTGITVGDVSLRLVQQTDSGAFGAPVEENGNGNGNGE